MRDSACRRVAASSMAGAPGGGADGVLVERLQLLAGVVEAAADLHDHLVFNPEVGWAGPSAPSLTDAIVLLEPAPALALQA